MRGAEANCNNIAEKNRLDGLSSESDELSKSNASETVIIYPSSAYLWILFASEEILKLPLDVYAPKEYSALDLRIYEVKSLMSALNKKVDFTQPAIMETMAALIPTSTEDIQLREGKTQ